MLVGGEFRDRPLAIADGLIAQDAPAVSVDLAGYWLLPGIVDLHGDGFERHIHPRPSAPFPLIPALDGVAREAAAHGVTTVHLALSWSWEGGLRSPDAAEDILSGLDAYRKLSCGIDLRAQIRAETHLIEAVPRLIDSVRRHDVRLVIFNNHLDEALQIQQSDPVRFMHWAAGAGLTPEQLGARVDRAKALSAEVPQVLRQMAQAFNQMGVRLGSHDDTDAETRSFYRSIGARIAEFPTSHLAAGAAHGARDPVLMGAPNVVRGGSQAGNIAAEGLIRDGLCDALVSDYHLPALAMAAWALVDRGTLPLERAWAMISTSPAQIAGLTDRGQLQPGQRADLVVVNKDSRAIEAVIAAGRIVHLSGAAASRFVQGARLSALAAE